LNASIQSTQNCSATPVSYNQTACGPYSPTVLVEIFDDGSCVSTSSYCVFSPANITVQLGTTVMWFNYGSLTHTLTSCSSAACPYTVSNPDLPGLDSVILLPHYGSFSFAFTAKGNYTYYDPTFPRMHGTVIVGAYPPYPSPPPSFPMPTISLAGSLGWTVDGRDNNVAVLNVSHQVSIVLSSSGVSFTPVTEKGSLSQSIDLSTRVESAGTATSVILGIIQKMLANYPGYYGYYGYGYSPGLGQLLSSQKEVYTFWWVNGPLTNGQPVEILTGYDSVMGSETVDLGPGNNRNAWIVESELSQSLSTTSPPVITAGGSSDSSFKLDLRFDYDQASDLLLKSSAVVSVTSAQIQSYKPGDYLCGPSGCFPVSDPVTVSHHMSASIPITLQLKSTSLDLSRRSPQGSTGQASPATSLPPTMSLWVYAGIGIVGAGAVGTLAWLLRRRTRIGTPAVQPEPVPDASPTLTAP